MNTKIYPRIMSANPEDEMPIKKYVKIGKRQIAQTTIFNMLTGLAFLIVIGLIINILTHLKGPTTAQQQMSRRRVSLYAMLFNIFYSKEMPVYNMSYVTTSDQPLEKVISCYYNTPSMYQSPELLPSDINPHLCTHINIAFAQIENKEIVLHANQERAIKEVTKLKLKNPKLKILLSVGGGGPKNGFSDMVIDHASRKVFIKSIKFILRNYTLDGIDLDWEFPAIHNNEKNDDDPKKSRERQHFSQLLREIREEYKREKRDYLLTVAAPAPEFITTVSYDVDQLNLYTDFVNIMTYDFHAYTRITPFTGLNSPLYPDQDTNLYMSELNINYTVHMYMGKGLQPDKIVVGIPTYGHSFHLVNPENGEIGSPANFYGSLGSLGFVDYPDVCKFIEKYKSDVIIREDNATRVPYLHRVYEWVSYDNPESVMSKANFIKENNFRGAMIYSLNADDYQGVCQIGGTEKFPLSHSIRNTLVDTADDE